MTLTATGLGAVVLSEAQKEEFQRRASSFFERFPQSKVIRTVEFSKDAGAEEMMLSMKVAIGLTEERERALEQLETQLRSGKLPMPFSWRPRLALGNVQDVAHLWELTKVSTLEDKQLHLNMIVQPGIQRPMADFQAKTPLLDLITLFVLRDLDLIDLLFEFFPKIAIGQATLAELTRMAQVFSGSIFREKCAELQTVLRSHLAQILQPQGGPSDEDERIPRSSREIKSLVSSDSFALYSDDAVLRTWALEERFASAGMCTLDFLYALEETGHLGREQVAERLAKLCDWRVGVEIHLRHHIALIRDEVRNASSVSEGVALLSADPRFMSIADGIWSPSSDFDGSLKHIGFATRQMVQDPLVSDIAIGSFIGIWLEKVKKRHDVPVSSLDLATHIVLVSIIPERLPIPAVRRLWKVYFGVVGSLGRRLDGKSATAALARLAVKAGGLDAQMKRESVQPSSTIGERLMTGLDIGSNAWIAFCTAYPKGL